MLERLSPLGPKWIPLDPLGWAGPKHTKWPWSLAGGPGPQGAPKGPRGAPTGPHGAPMGPHGAPTGPHGAPRGPTGAHGAQRGPTVPHGSPWDPWGPVPLSRCAAAVPEKATQLNN